MSRVTKGKISKVKFNHGIYSSAKSKKVKEYVEHAIKQHCETQGITSKGADEVEINSGGHAGGKVKTEPFHITFQAKKPDGSAVKTINPHNNHPTNTHHFYIAKDKADLEAKANAFAAKK